MTPTEASLESNKIRILNSQAYVDSAHGKPKFKVSDKVRLSRVKGVFEQGYLPNWSEALYVVTEVKKTNPFTYVLKDMNDEMVLGSFYGEELQKSKQEKYRIEKIIRKKKIDGVQYGFVKWIGYSDKFNTWEPISELERLI